MYPGFSLGCLHMGGTSAGGQSINGGPHEGGHRPYGGGPIFDRLYHKLKALLLLSSNYMMQFIWLRLYSNSLIYILWLLNSHSNAASIQNNRGDKSHYVTVALLILLQRFQLLLL